METIIDNLRQELKTNTDRQTLSTAGHCFKEPIKFYGVKAAAVATISKKYFDELKGKNKEAIFSLCEALLRSDYEEEAWIAFDWSERLHKQFLPPDFDRFESWIEDYVNNWAKCDTLCNHTVGTFIEMYPHFLHELKKWARSKNRWLRRAAAISLILPARKGKFLNDVFAIADILLKDEDGLVQKGYGWLLKEASKTHRYEVFDYIVKQKRQMPRTALRCAIEKMPDDLREQAMAKS